MSGLLAQLVPQGVQRAMQQHDGAATQGMAPGELPGQIAQPGIIAVRPQQIAVDPVADDFVGQACRQHRLAFMIHRDGVRLQPAFDETQPRRGRNGACPLRIGAGQRVKGPGDT